MQRRCCWPPESARPDCVETVLHFVPEGRLLERLLDLVGKDRLLRDTGDTQAVRHVFEDRLGEWVRLLEHHADAASHEHRIDVVGVYLFAVELDAPCDAHAVDGQPFMRLSERKNVLLPQPLGPMSARTSFACASRDTSRTASLSW